MMDKYQILVKHMVRMKQDHDNGIEQSSDAYIIAAMEDYAEQEVNNLRKPDVIKSLPLYAQTKIIDEAIILAIPSMNPDDFVDLENLLTKLRNHLIKCESGNVL